MSQEDSVTKENLIQLTELVWGTALELKVNPIEDVRPPEGGLRDLNASVHFTGAWEGALTVWCPAALGRLVASRMFGIRLEDAQVSEIQDAVGEVANMIGGNLKPLLPSPSNLSMPSTAEGSDYSFRIPGSRVLYRVAMACGEDRFFVSLLERDRSKNPRTFHRASQIKLDPVAGQ